MNILHVVNIYFVLPYFIGDQFLFFQKKGYNIHVICSPSEHLREYAFVKKFRYKEVPILRSISVIPDLHALFIICRYIKKNKIDIIIGHTPKGSFLSMIAGFIMRVPKRIYFRHGLVYETSNGFKRKFLMFMEKITGCCSTQIVCVSPSLSIKSIEDKLNTPEKQIILGRGTCGGIDAQVKFNPNNISNIELFNLKRSLSITENDYVIGFCGRLVKDKGIVELVDAFKKLPNNFKLILVGDFEERDALSLELIDEIEKNNRIIKTGFIFNNIEYFYSLMHMFILPSYREGFPTSVLEASAMDLPVLTTKATGCIDSIVEGETGYFISNNSDSIYNGILKIQDRNINNKLGVNGRSFVLNNFDNQIIWPIIEKEIYKK